MHSQVLGMIQLLANFQLSVVTLTSRVKLQLVKMFFLALVLKLFPE